MIGKLPDAITALLARELAATFGGTPPKIRVTVASVGFDIDPSSLDAQAGEPREDDQTDEWPFDAQSPGGPYTLSQPPLAGPRRVWLITTLGDRIALRDPEVSFDNASPARLSLSLAADRPIATIAKIRLLYSVRAVFAAIKYVEDFTLSLEGTDADALEDAEALAVAVLAIERGDLLPEAAKRLTEGRFGAALDVHTLRLVSGATPAAGVRQLRLRAEMTLKATRTLDAGGGPILRIGSPGRPADPARPVDIVPDIEA